MITPEQIRDIAVRVAHAAAQEAVTTMVEAEFHAWLRDLGIEIPSADAQQAWKQAEPWMRKPQVTVTFPALYEGVGDPTAIPAETESENGDTPA